MRSARWQAVGYLVFGLIFGMVGSAAAQAPAAPQPPTATLKVATREAPPFAFKGADGQWEGIAIDLWKQIAQTMHLAYRFEPASLSDMIDGVAKGQYDASVAAMTITAKRESVVDFTQPFYTTGFGIAVPSEGANWFALVLSVFSWKFLQAVLALAVVLLCVGVLTWLFERRRNPDFGGSWWSGLASAFWFSAVTMTTVGYGDKTPRTFGGRMVALTWMFAAIIVISTFTGMIASALTASHFEGRVRGQNDLASVRVGSVPKSASDGWLTGRHVGFDPYADVESGLAALAKRRIDAFVYDRPLLQYLINKAPTKPVTLLPGSFGRQDYGIVLPQGSALREPMDRVLLQILQSREWEDIVFRYLGAAGDAAPRQAD